MLAVKVVGWPFTAAVGAVVRVLVSGLTVNVLDELSEPIGVVVVVSPGKEAVSVYELDGSEGVMTHEASPLSSVVAAGTGFLSH